MSFKLGLMMGNKSFLFILFYYVCVIMYSQCKSRGGSVYCRIERMFLEFNFCRRAGYDVWYGFFLLEEVKTSFKDTTMGHMVVRTHLFRAYTTKKLLTLTQTRGTRSVCHLTQPP